MLFPKHSETEMSNTKTPPILFFLIVGLFIAARLWRLSNYPLWLDEIFSFNIARRGYGELIRVAVWDTVHPPFFYLLLKMWIGIGGTSLSWLRLFPALTAIAAIIPFYLLCKELRLHRAEISTALLLMAVNGYLIYYAHELRMYSLLFFVTLCSVWLFMRWVNSEERQLPNLAWLFAINLLLIYTHYFGWLVVGSELIYLLFLERRRWLSFFVSNALLCLCFAPWFYLVARAVIERRGTTTNLSPLTSPHVSDFIWFYATMHGSFSVPRTTTLGLIIFGGPLLVWEWRAMRGYEKVSPMLSWGLALFSFLPVLIAFFASWLLPQPVWEDKYLIVAAAPYFILIALSVNRLRPHWMRMTVITFVIAWAVVAGVGAMRSETKIRWDVLARTMSEAELTRTDRVLVFAFGDFVAAPLELSLYQEGEHRFDVCSVREITDLQGTHYWVAVRDTSWRGAILPQNWLKERGCQVGSKTSLGTPEQKVIIFAVDCH